MNATELQSYPISVTPPVNGSLLAYETANNAWTPDPQTTPPSGGIYYWNGTNVVTNPTPATAGIYYWNGSNLETTAGGGTGQIPFSNSSANGYDWTAQVVSGNEAALLFWTGTAWAPSNVGGVGGGSFPYWSGSNYSWTPPLGGGNVGLILYWSGTAWTYFANGIGVSETGYVATWNGTAWTVAAPVSGSPVYASASNVVVGSGTTNLIVASSPPNGLYRLNVFIRVNNTVQVTLTAYTTNTNGAQNYPIQGAVNSAPSYVTVSALALANPDSVVCVPIIIQAYNAPFVYLQIFTNAANCVFVSGTLEQISSSI